MATHYRPRQVTAQIIWDFLVANGPSSWNTIQRGTGLTHSQLAYGMGMLKDELQTKNGQPLIWVTRDGVYDLTDSEGDWQEYLMQFTLRRIYTQLLRAESCAIAGGTKFGKHKKATRVAIAGITAARQMVEALV